MLQSLRFALARLLSQLVPSSPGMPRVPSPHRDPKRLPAKWHGQLSLGTAREREYLEAEPSWHPEEAEDEDREEAEDEEGGDGRADRVAEREREGEAARAREREQKSVAQAVRFAVSRL
ncbi:hypothetical protein BTVI_46100 [Pitangus sulphuratus]|nr:hypothetical protein BTVI_46100 [Pitangus sulphuratus]